MAAQLSKEDMKMLAALSPEAQKAALAQLNELDEKDNELKVLAQNSVSLKPLAWMNQLEFIVFQLACCDPKTYDAVEKYLNAVASAKTHEELKANIAEIKKSVDYLNLKVK